MACAGELSVGGVRGPAKRGYDGGGGVRDGAPMAPMRALWMFLCFWRRFALRMFLGLYMMCGMWNGLCGEWGEFWMLS